MPWPEGETSDEVGLLEDLGPEKAGELEAAILFDRLPSAFYQRPGRRVRPRDE